MSRFTYVLLLLCFITVCFHPPTGGAQNVVTTYSGTGSPGLKNGARDTAMFHSPFGMCIDKNNNIYIADNGNNCIRKINTSTGIVQTYAGTGVAGWKDGKADTAQFNNPADVCVDESGNVYVADFLNQRIRKISVTGMVSTVAGSGVAGFADGSASTAKFNYPRGIVRDHAGNLYIGDSWNHRIRKVNTSGTVSTYAGGGTTIGVGSIGDLVNANDTSARFYTPSGLAIDQNGNVYVADAYNHRIRKISTSQVVTTYAGTGATGVGQGGFMNGNSAAAIFNTPTEVFVDTNANELYIGDTFNNLIRRMNMTSSMVSTFAGNGNPGFVNGADSAASFNYTRGVVVDSSGKMVYVSDFNNNAIRLIAPQGTNGIHDDPWTDDITIFPNPSSGMIFVAGSSRISRLDVYDILGNKVKSVLPGEDQLRVDLSGFSKGVYIFKIMVDLKNSPSACHKVISY